MRISTEIGSAAELVGERRAVELVGKAGFDAWDLTLESNGFFSDANQDNLEDKLKMLADSAHRLDAMMIK